MLLHSGRYKVIIQTLITQSQISNPVIKNEREKSLEETSFRYAGCITVFLLEVLRFSSDKKKVEGIRTA